MHQINFTKYVANDVEEIDYEELDTNEFETHCDQGSLNEIKNAPVGLLDYVIALLEFQKKSTCYQEACKFGDVAPWKIAMIKETKALHKNGT
jgi:hypothetical protein